MYGGQGFVWYRFWVRPFVPDIGAIPDADRAYYQDYMLSVFNNPHNVDFGADALWTIHPPEEAEELAGRFDAEVWAPIDAAVELATESAEDPAFEEAARKHFGILRDRLRAYRSYCRTVRNIVGWIAGVHGYLNAEDDVNEAGRDSSKSRRWWRSELQNTRDLLDLWESTDVNFIPITESGETMHTYGANLGELLRKKIELTERYGDRDPYIDPEYMWRMPEGAGLDEDVYRGY